VGAVGAGGLGTEIVGTINAIDYRRTSTLLLTLIVLIAVIGIFGSRLKFRPALLWFGLPFGAAALWFNRPTSTNLSHALATVSTMFPPQLPFEAIQQIPRLLIETAEIAIGGTILAALAALPLGLCAARTLSPPLLSIPVRRALESLRAVPEVVWGLLLVSVVGWLGPGAGVVALALHSTGSLGRLYTESIENVPTGPTEAISATGAPRVCVGVFACCPLALPAIAVHTLFRLEWNVRAATVVGVIGAGGIGEALYNAQQLFFYKEMIAYVLITWGLIWTIDVASGALRTRLQLMETAS